MRYFFDTWNNGDLTQDDEGLLFDSPQEARKVAIASLPEMALDTLPAGDALDIAVDVRDETGERLFRAELRFTSEWLVARGKQ